MKIEKNKIVFSALLLCILLFIGAYTMLVIDEDEAPTLDNNQIPVPELEGGEKEYKSKLEALDDLKEVRQVNIPSIYDERLMDSTGVYDPNFLDKEKIRIVDSIYGHGRINYTDSGYRKSETKTVIPPKIIKRDTIAEIEESETKLTVKEQSLEHQLFFTSHPIHNEELSASKNDAFIYVRVDGTQTVKTNHRLQMRLTKAAYINNILLPKHTLIYGFVSFKSNRTIVSITNVNHRPVKLNAYDLQDGSEGIYIENSITAEASNEVIGDVVDGINIAGVPQISGVRKIFQRNHRNVKITVTDNYELLLRTSKNTFN